jgi:hypothetical protein
MFKFLKFGLGKKSKVVIETQRQTFERLVLELNEAIDALDEKPAVTLSPMSGNISFALPEHFPDEALALPAPAQTVEAVAEVASEKVEDAEEVAAETVEVVEDAAVEVIEAANDAGDAGASKAAEVADIVASAKVVSK